MTPFDPGAEFDRQVRVLLDKGYPALAGMSVKSFTELLGPLRAEAVSRCASAPAPTSARAPFALVVSTDLVPADQAMPHTELDRRPGFADFDPADIARFATIDGVDVPADPVYLVLDLDRGKETLNVSPDDALPGIIGAGRTPLTVAEGIAFLTHFPASLEKNNCYMLAGSRCDDRRVPALWISKRAPKLGWCWAGNRHTWLGIASSVGRVGPPT